MPPHPPRLRTVQGRSRRCTQRRTPAGHAEGTHTGDWGSMRGPVSTRWAFTLAHALRPHARKAGNSTPRAHLGHLHRQRRRQSGPSSPRRLRAQRGKHNRRGCMGRVRKNSGARGGRGKGASAPGVAACPTCPSPPRQRERRARQRHARGGETGACRGGTRPASPHGRSVPVMRTSGPRSVPAGAAHAPAHANAPTLRCRRKHAASTQRAHSRAAPARPASDSTPARSPPAPAPPHSLPLT